MARRAVPVHNLTAAVMFELGSSLREARRKRGLDLDAVQRELRIRKRYLEALEDERFELLPGDAYTRGFLRGYAEFLGLDGSLYVQEYNDRFAHHDELPIAATPTAARLRRRAGIPVVVAAVAAAAVAVGLAAWKLADHDRSAPTKRAAAAPSAATPAAHKQRPQQRHKPAAAKPRPSTLTLRAARGDCWVLVRLGSSTGPILYERTLRHGEQLRFGLRRPLWMRVGVGLNLDARVDGKPLKNLPRVTGNVLVRA